MFNLKIRKLNKKGVVVKYLIALILGLCILLVVLWIIFGTQTENSALVATIKDFF